MIKLFPLRWELRQPSDGFGRTVTNVTDTLSPLAQPASLVAEEQKGGFSKVSMTRYHISNSQEMSGVITVHHEVHGPFRGVCKRLPRPVGLGPGRLGCERPRAPTPSLDPGSLSLLRSLS